MIKLAFYKGPPDSFKGWIAHIAIMARTFSNITHVELQVDGVCYSSSGIDGGVRSKDIDVDDGHWEVIEIGYDQRLKEQILEFFDQTKKAQYDFASIIKFVIPFYPPEDDRWHCSEWVADALQLGIASYKITPKDIYKYSLKHYA